MEAFVENAAVVADIAAGAASSGVVAASVGVVSVDSGDLCFVYHPHDKPSVDIGIGVPSSYSSVVADTVLLHHFPHFHFHPRYLGVAYNYYICRIDLHCCCTLVGKQICSSDLLAVVACASSLENHLLIHFLTNSENLKKSDNKTYI